MTTFYYHKITPLKQWRSHADTKTWIIIQEFHDNMQNSVDKANNVLPVQ